LMAFNKMTDAVKDRQRALGSPEQQNRQLQQLKEAPGSDGPASEFMKDLAKGDFEKAAKDMKSLQEKLAAGKMNEAEKQQLKKQLESMSKQLKQLANLDERKKQLDKAKESGGLSQQQYDKEMQKLDQQKQNLQNLQKLAEQLQKAGEQMSKNDLKKAAEQLGMSQKQMEEMAQQMQELQSLDSALAELQDAKDGMAGDKLNQLGEGMDQFGMGKRKNQMGKGGRGQGQGARAEAEDDVAMYSTKAKGQVSKGKAVLEGFAPPSKQVKGQSIIPMQGEAETTSGAASDALSGQKVPKSVEKHVRAYIDSLNKPQ
jgi:myosin heavy subunit